MAITCLSNWRARGSRQMRIRCTRFCDGSRSRGTSRSEWNTDQSRPRKFYLTSDEGERLAEMLTREWQLLTRAIASLTDEEK